MEENITIELLRNLCHNNTIRITKHSFSRMLERGISFSDIKNAIMTGEIIEQYPDDYPHPSCLVLSLDAGEKPLHAVVGYAVSELWIITAYHPTSDKFEKDYKTRKEQN